MSRSKEPRELQFTGGQLVVVFVLVIALGAFIFVLGVSVGKKQARMAEGPLLPPQTSAGKVARQAKPAIEPQSKVASQPQPKTSQPPVSSDKAAKSEIQKEVASFQAQQKTSKAATQETKAGVSKPQPKTQSKTAPAEVKTAPKPAVSETKSPPGPAPATAKTPLKTASGQYYIQVAAASQKSEAQQLADSIKKMGFNVVVLDPLPTDRAPYFRVRVGGYATEEDRSQAAASLASLLNRKPSDFYYPPLEKTK